MARIRSVHPGFFKDEDLVSVSMAARLLFIGLGVEADDKGVFEWKPLTIKMNVFPAETFDINETLEELEAVNAVCRYEISGRKYGAIRNFRKFQRPKTPNDIHPITDEMRNFVGLAASTSEAVPNDFRNVSEIDPQMEDGGGRREEGVRVSTETLTQASESAWEDFEKLYPQASGRKTARADWERIVNAGASPSEILAGLKGSIAYWAQQGITGRWIPKASTWLADSGWTHHVGVTPTGKPVAVWTGPDDIRKRVVAALGETGAASYLDPAVWLHGGVVETTTDYAAGKLRSILPEITVRKREAA